MEFCPDCGAYGPSGPMMRGSTERVGSEFGEVRRLHSKNCATARIYRKLRRFEREHAKNYRAERARLKADPAEASVNERKQTL